MEIAIFAQHATKIYGKVKAVDDLSFTVQRGEMVGLLGPNGAGKTTVIHMLLGLLAPTSGNIRVLGLSPLKDRPLLAQKINFSSAYVQLPSNLKIIENMKIFAGLYGISRPLEKIKFLLNLFNMDHLAKRLTGALSAGEKTRLNLCKALLNDPEVLLLDEPTASLDPEMALNVRNVLQKIQKERHLSVIYTSHNMVEVQEMCDRVLFLNHGREVLQGKPHEILKELQYKTLDEVFIAVARRKEGAT
ncbi:MAG: ABC transporter ATP-binding protein [Deltaproteobacteria bacterium GWA2_45_12]|nr:MAG: ABC transporter ATP-binding protein [Deltaproteobacteria bacterium GWA2_45_12]